ncbi:MAG: TerL [Burkholderiales bacterium]|nr:TerL [Burkholderiales bacterium]
MSILRINYDSSDAPTVRRFWDSDAFVRGLMGPFGSGKSSACVMEVLRRTARQRPNAQGVRRARFVVVRNTYQQLNDTTIKTFMDWLPPQQLGQWWKSEHFYLIDKIPGMHIEVLFRALDRPDQVSNLLSAEYTGAWVNEAREVPWTIIDALQGRVGRYPSDKEEGCSWAGIWMDTNPPDTDSKFYHYFEELRPHNAALFKQPSGLADDAENLTHLGFGERAENETREQKRARGRSYYENLMLGKREDFIRVYVHGNYGFVQDGKPVYPEFSDSVHVRDVKPVAGIPIQRGWDFGLTPATTFSQSLPNGQWLILDELVSDNMGITRHGEAVLRHSNEHFPGYSFVDWGDPAGAQRAQTDERSCFDILRGMGIAIQPSEQSPTIRIESVRQPLMRMIDGQPAVLLDPRCRTLRKGFTGKYRYRRMQTSAERYTDEPEKNEYSHVHDALQYVAAKQYANVLRNTVGITQLKPLEYSKLPIY